MALAPGTRLGPYEVVSPIGKGGMGEVYRAHDTKLGRDVAIKVLPEEFARNKERLDRFEREARLLAQLNHSNIATLHGLEEHDGQQFLVMELVEGETLAARIAQGALPVDEAVPLFIQIAEGLEAAHEKGIIHRDLKPANIKIGPDAKPKILDFGLAKAFVGDESAADSSQSPTLTKGTALGAIIGTASYMSPEQARGRKVDHRTDVWAFGACLYEALTARKPFGGDNITDVLAAVVRAEPDWTQLPASASSRLRRLITRCLQKNVRERIQHVGDARIELSDNDELEPALVTGPGSRPILPVVGAILVTALVSGLIATQMSRRGDSPFRSVSRFSISAPERTSFTELQGTISSRYPSIAVSANGTRLVYAASDNRGASQLYLRTLDSFDSRALPGTENGEVPVFSPDGEWLAFWAKGAVFRVPVVGGAPIEVGRTPASARGSAWSRDGTIVLGGANRGLLRMEASGGDAIMITELDLSRGDEYHAFPEALPDGEHILFTVATGDSSEIAVLSLRTDEWHIVSGLREARQARYLESGYLVYYRAGALFAAPFSIGSLSLTGPEIPVPDSVLKGEMAGLEIGYFTASSSGVLAFVPDAGPGVNRLVRVDRRGEEKPLPVEPGNYRYGVSLSPDGQRLAVGVQRERGSVDIWVLDVSLGTRTRLTSQGSNVNPHWSSDGASIFYGAFPAGSFDVYRMLADGGGAPEAILTGDGGQTPTSLSPDGNFLVVEDRSDLFLVSLNEDSKEPLVVTDANETSGRISPDGGYLAYVSDESGRQEIYVGRISGDEGKTPISTGGGRSPRWSPRGDEIFYWRGTALMRVGIELEPTIRPSQPQMLFEGRYRDDYDISEDGQYFIMVTRAHPELTALRIVLNWDEDLKQRIPTGN